MRWTRPAALALALLALASPVALAAVAPAGAPMAGVRGQQVAPRSVSFEMLPRITMPYRGPILDHPEGVNEEAEKVLELLKRNPRGIRPSEVAQFTLDPGGTGPLAPVPGTGFEGITQGGYIPSEPTVAAGPLNIFSAGNVSVTVTNKDGTNRVETDGQAFFGVTAGEGAISDAQCYYDAVHGRFIAVSFTQGSSPTKYSNFYLAISKTNDARGAWWLYKLDMTKDGGTSTTNWSDYEALGVSEDKIALTAQQFSFAGNNYQYQKIRVLDRAAAYSGATLTWVDFFNFAAPPGGGPGDLFVTKAARDLTPGDSTIHCLTVNTNGASRVAYRTVTGPPGAPVLSAGNLVSCSAYSPPPDAAQKGSTQLVATNDCRPGDFYVRNGVLTVAWHTSASIGGTVSAIRLFRMRTSDRTVLTDETYGAAGTFYYYPAATVDSAGTIFLGFDRSSSTEYPSSYVTGKRRADGSIEPSVLLKAGLSATSQSRWGDYTGIDNDASASGPGAARAWYAGQWTKATNTFGTWINQLTFTYGQVAGTVLDDCDGDPGTAGDRAPLAGVALALKQGATTLATTTTDAGGAYNFGYLETGTYDVVVTPPAGGSAVDAVPGTGGTSQTRVSASDLQVNLTNAQTSSGNQFLVTSTHAAPVAASLSPGTRNAGDGAFTLTVNGSGFVRCATVRVEGNARTTTWVSAAQLTAAIPAADVATAGLRVITVLNPAPGGGVSNPETLTVASGDVQAPTVTLSSPNGGETWKAGSSHAVTWSASDNVGVTAVDLFLSEDGGATFPDTIATGLANGGTFAWSVPDKPTAAARVRVVAHDAAANAGADTSNASFTIDRWTITASAGAGGSIAPTGAVAVVQGASQGFTIAPAPGHHVADVVVDAASVGPVTSYTFNAVSANHVITASFALDTLVITASAGANGAVAPAGAVSVPWGGTQAFGFTPATGYHVLDVQVDSVSVGSPPGYSFTNVVANHTLHVDFSLSTYSLTVTTTGGGTVAWTPHLAEYPYGTSVELTASPGPAWAFAGWSGDTVTNGNPLTRVIRANTLLSAAFADTGRPVVTIGSPVGGETFSVGVLENLAWTATDNAVVADVTLLLSRAGAGGPFDTLATGLAGSTSYGWTVTGPATTNAFFKVVAVDSAGNSGAATSDSAFTILDQTAVADGPVRDFELSPMRPNPSRGHGVIGFAVPRAAPVRVSVVDIQGREVAVLAEGDYPAGRHEVAWEAGPGRAARPGLYFVRLRAPGRTLVRRVVLTR